jgi:alkanesulfonate monooxygenase SsuD/methylene tetrahydromethanopterin reductase-like flavin-dependent oxidoreductase (luciferase family)
VTDLRFGIELPQHLGFEHLKDMALAAERLGYDSVWVRDHLIISPAEMTRFQHGYIVDGERRVSGGYLSCLPTIAALAAATRRVTIGTDILNIPRRNPVDVANEAAAIDEISEGRFILQGAIGHPTRDWEPLGITTSLRQRGEMLEEGIEIIKLLWTHDAPVSYHGRHYTLDEARIGSRPVQLPHPPIWLGVGKTYRRVARYASGFTLTGSMFGGGLEDFKRALERIRAEAVSAGRDPDEITPAARFAVVVGEDEVAAKSRARRDWTSLWGREEPWFTEWAGGGETIAGIIQPYIDAGARHIMLWPLPYGSADAPMRDLEAFAEGVIPLLDGGRGVR